jgi:thioredoxin reductase (NADPH)
VVVAGGGDAALSEAIHLGQFARTVTVVTRGEMFRARRSYVSRIADDERFRLRWATEIVEVLGGDYVEGVRVRDRETGEGEVVACSGLFVFVGLGPNAGLLAPEVARDADGFVVTDAGFETSMPGVFAIGAVRASYGGRLTQAVAEATTAAERAAARCED